MAEKLTVDHMAVEMDVLWGRLKELELALSRKLDTTVRSTTANPRHPLTTVSSRRISDLVSNTGLRDELVQRAAYFKAERSGFAAGDDLQNWLEAEQEVDRLLLEGRANTDSAGPVTGRANPGEIAAVRMATRKRELSHS